MVYNIRKELGVDAFKNACNMHRADGMIVDSDLGSQFTSHAFRDTLIKMVIVKV